MKNKKYTVIDFFCGAGGFSTGFDLNGFEVIMGIDNWAPAIKTHNANFNLEDTPIDVLKFNDINKIFELPDTDIIIGSPPCVVFSTSNKGGNSNKLDGLKLIKTYLKVIAVKKYKNNSKLKAWLMENVPNVGKYMNDTYTFSDLDLTEWAISSGYNPEMVALDLKNKQHIVNSYNYGSVQKRLRYICGEIIESNKFPELHPIVNKKTVNSIFKDFPKPNEKSLTKFENIVDPNYTSIKISNSSLHDHFYDTGVYKVEWKKAMEAKLNHPYMGKMSFPENLDKEARTIMATMSASSRESILIESEISRIGDGQYRLLTVREAATIMGFPINYQFYGNESSKWRLVGNAVVVQLSYTLAKSIKSNLGLNFQGSKMKKLDFSDFIFFDNFELKDFNNPPKRNPNSIFRLHPIKAGNMTVELTNRLLVKYQDKTISKKWKIVINVGTGKKARHILIHENHKLEAEELLLKHSPIFLEELNNDKVIHKYTDSHFNNQNREYGYISESRTHPYNLVYKIKNHIENQTDNTIYLNPELELFKIKATMPLHQLMAIYALGKLLYS